MMRMMLLDDLLKMVPQLKMMMFLDDLLQMVLAKISLKMMP
jgi:hypothetical protein